MRPTLTITKKCNSKYSTERTDNKSKKNTRTVWYFKVLFFSVVSFIDYIYRWNGLTIVRSFVHNKIFWVVSVFEIAATFLEELRKIKQLLVRPIPPCYRRGGGGEDYLLPKTIVFFFVHLSSAISLCEFGHLFYSSLHCKAKLATTKNKTRE